MSRWLSSRAPAHTSALGRRATAPPASEHAEGAPTSVGRSLLAMAQRHTAWLIAALVLLVYLPSLPGDFLVYDDPWLVELNPILRARWFDAFHSIFFDLSLEARLSLGAEYLPLRDVTYWLDTLLGLDAAAMRAEQVMMYVAAVLLLRAALLACLPSRAAAEVATLCFALHPVHVESVAWIAGRKDVLALLFVAAALRAYEARGSARWAVVPLLACAHFSKSMSVVAAGLLLAQDLLANRRPRWAVLSACALVAFLSAAVHGHVGSRVFMVGGPLSGGPWAAVCTMGEVWLSYLKILVWPPSLAIVHEVSRRDHLGLASLLGWSMLVGGAVLGGIRLRRGQPFALGVWLWTVLPLVPVSQVLFPLQNVMADRYLWLSTLGMGLALSALWQRRPGSIVAVVMLGVLGGGSAWRAALFGDGAELFSRDTRITQGGLAPCLLGDTLVRQGDVAGAERAYRVAIERPCGNACEPARRASNALALLLIGDGRGESAEPVLREAILRFPDEPKLHFNLVKLLYRLGKVEESRALDERSIARFPNYRSTGERRPRF